MDNHEKVPSVYSYSRPSRAREVQWGANLSPNAVAMMHTKLELDYMDNRSDELDLILKALDGMSDLTFDEIKKHQSHPDYTWNSPEEIATDYLRKIFERVQIQLGSYGETVAEKYPMDIVITVPAVYWSNIRAQSS